MSLTQAGRWPPIRGPPARLFGSSGRRFPPRFDAGREHSSVVKHVESCGDVLSDAGSTPAASTIPRFARSGVGAGVRQVGFASLCSRCGRELRLGSPYRHDSRIRYPSRFARSGVGAGVRQVGFGLAASPYRHDSRRLHQLSSMNMGLGARRSRRLHYFSTAIAGSVSNNRIAASSAAGLRCM